MSNAGSYPWFRMYSEFLNDPKIIALAFEDQRHFIGLLALKCDGTLDSGAAPDLMDRIVAQRMWIDHAVIREVKKRLVAGGLISEDWQPLGWEKRQMRSDSSTARVAKHREKKKAESGNGGGNVSGNEAGNGDETFQQRQGNGLEEDKEEDKERETREGSRSSSHASKSITLKTYLADCKAQNVKPIPEDHHIRQDMTDAGISDDMAQIAWLRFREEHTTGLRKDKKYKDWPAVFANSVRDRWYRFWTVHADGPAQWTSEGQQAKRVADAAAAAREAA